MDFLEKDLEEIIYLSDKNLLSDRGLYLNGKLKRQVKIGNYGIADLIHIERPVFSKNYGFNHKEHYKGLIEVIELKKDKIGVSTFFQALNYVKGIQRYLEKRNCKFLFNYKITLIGREIDQSSSFCYLGDLFGQINEMISTEEEPFITIDLYKYSYDITGLSFKSVYDYKLINEGF